MSIVTQRVKLEPDPILSEEIHVKIPKKGKIKPSEIKVGYSGIPKIVQIIVYTSTNYVPGKISFEKTEET